MEECEAEKAGMEKGLRKVFCLERETPERLQSFCNSWLSRPKRAVRPALAAGRRDARPAPRL